MYNQDSDLLLHCDEVRVTLPDGKTERDIAVEKARPADGAILAKLKGVNDRDQALLLQGSKVSIPRDKFPPLEDGEFYVCDIVGTSAQLDGEAFGTVADLRSYPTLDVLVVKTARGTYEVPLTEAFVERVSADGVALRSIEGLEPD